MDHLQLLIEQIKNRIEPDFTRTIDVDEGWYPLVVSLDAQLLLLDPDYKVFQIKEKFGGLRFYMKASKPENVEVYKKMQKLIRDYEQLSLKTCEATGKEGVLMRSSLGRYKTLNIEFASMTPHLKSYTPVIPTEDEWWDAIK